MKKVLLLLFWVNFSVSSLAQKKDSVRVDSTKIIQVGPPVSSNNQAFPFLNVVSPSPEAAGLGRYGEIPVSLSTGTTSFEVPIYEIVSGSLKVPIKLSNHSAGIKVNDIASSVGTGWSLQAGGVISRTMKGGLWDDCALGYLNQVIPEQTDLANFRCFLGNLNTTTNYVDGMPDDFYYNFNEMSGKMIFNSRTLSNQNISPIPITYPHSALKIEWINQLYFRITDIDGTVYKFEDLETTSLAQSGRSNPCSSSYTSAWYLTQIISANKIDVINFVYTPFVRITASRMYSTTLTKEVNSYGLKTFAYSYANQRSDINSIMLSEINYKNGKVTFTYAKDRQDQSDADVRRLTTITVYKKDASEHTTVLKKFILNHSYFDCSDGRSQVDNPPLNITGHPFSFLLKRLRLDSVTETTANDITLPPYTFNYYENYPLAIFGALAQDYWGYSNNAITNNNLLLWNTDPTKTQEPSATYGANCTPNFDYAVSGSLKRITYPTGGYSDFVYESNTIMSGGVPVEGGGIRIKKIVSNGNNNSPTQTSYNYISSFFTNNIYDGAIDDNLYNYTTEIVAEDPGNSQINCVRHFITTYPEKVSVSLGSESSFIAHEEVEEYKEDGLGNRLGKKKYTYSTSFDPSYVEFPLERASASWKRGQLLNEKTYSILPNNSEVLVQEQQTNYTELPQPYKTRGYVTRLSFDNDYYTGFCQIVGNRYCSRYSEYNDYIFAEITEQSSVLLPTQTITIIYDQNGQNPVQSMVAYEYSPIHLQQTKKTEQRSNGATLEMTNKYPHEFSGNIVYDEMVNRHIFSPIIETEESENSISLKKTRTNYKRWYPSTVFGGVNGFFAPSSVETQEQGGVWETEIVMGEKLINPTQSGYDLRARPVIYTDRSNLNTVLEWWDETGKKDLLKRKTTLNQYTNYDYVPLVGQKSVLNQSNQGIKFFYDDFNRLSLSQDHDNNKLAEYFYTYGTPNRVTTWQYRVPTTGVLVATAELSYTINHAYFDGLGRPIQQVGEGQSPKQKDIVFSNQSYDRYNRVISELTVGPSNNDDGTYVPNATSLAQSFYGDAAPFVSPSYEASPLGRTRSSFGLGNAWRVANKKMQYFDESAGTDIRYYVVDNAGNIALNGTYPANSLFKKRIIDEQGNTSIEISDKQGRTVQRQQMNGSDLLTTYYIYDGLGRVLAILQPEAYALNSGIQQSSSAWQGRVFFYKYDARGRVTESYVPNGGYTNNVYDKADRQVLSQDAHQQSLGRWSYQKYDALSRGILSGELSNNNSRSTLQSLFNGQATLSETFDANKPDLHYYSNESFPFSVDSSAAIQINYYDAYTAWRSTDFEPSDSYFTNSTGLMTGTKNRYTQNRKFLTQVFYHDTKSRVKESKKENILGDVERVSKNYRFLGGVSSYQRLYLLGNNKGSLYYSNAYSYDGVERKKENYLFMSFSPSGISLSSIVDYLYNEIGQLVTKKIQPNRQYQIANSPNYINRPPALGESNTQDIANKAVIISPGFTAVAANASIETYLAEIDTTHANGLTDALQTINYDYHIRGQVNCINCRKKQVNIGNKENDLFSMKLSFEEDKRYYDGNISKQTWKTSPLSGSPAAPNSGVAKARNYLYTYDNSSRLLKAKYGGGNSGENFSIDTMRYDRNGNILQLKRQGTGGLIDNLSYTYNGNQLLKVVDSGTNDGFKNGTNTDDDYGYWANGSLKYDKNKGIDSIVYNSYLKKVSRVKFVNGNWENFYYDGAGTLLKRKLSNNDEWIYRDEILQKNGEVYQINFDEGRAIYDSLATKWVLHYDYRDHQGNLRLSFRDSLATPVNGIYAPPVITQISETDPWGLQIKQLSYEKNSINNFKFQNQEKISDFGLNLNWFKYRPFDPETGRGWQVDRLAVKYAHNSVYAFSENKVTNHIELDGLEAVKKDNFTNSELPTTANSDNTKTSKQSVMLAKDKPAYNSNEPIKGGFPNGDLRPASQQNASISQGSDFNHSNVEKAGHLGVDMAGAAEGGAGLLKAGKGLAGIAKSKITNSVPNQLARVIPADINSKMLGAPNSADVFVTAADDIAGLNASQIASKLTIPQSSSGFKIIEFNTPSIGISSPVNRTNPGFVGFGRTAGGAREFTLPNQAVPNDATIKIIK